MQRRLYKLIRAASVGRLRSEPASGRQFPRRAHSDTTGIGGAIPLPQGMRPGCRRDCKVAHAAYTKGNDRHSVLVAIVRTVHA